MRARLHASLHSFSPLIVSATLSLLTGCLPSSNNSSACPSGKSFDSATRSCISQELQDQSSNQAPDPGAPAIYTADEGALTNLTFTLAPGSDNEGDTISYVMGTPPLDGTVTGCMDLTGSTGLADRSCIYTYDGEFAGTATLYYRLHDGHNFSEQLGVISFIVNPVNDTPSFVATPVATATAFYEDTPASLEFTIDEGNQGADEDSQSLWVTVTNLGNTLVAPNSSITIYYANTPVATANSSTSVEVCNDGDCADEKLKLVINPSPNSNTTSGVWGTDVVNLDITLEDDDGAIATLSNIGLNFNAVNDIPSFPTPTPLASATADEDTGAYASMYVDEGGGVDENSQTLSVSIAATPVSGTPIPASQVYLFYNSASLGNGSSSRSFGDGAISSDLSKLEFKVTPIANQFGITRYAVALTDSSGGTASASFAVTINSVDDAPTFPTSPAIATTTAVAYATEDVGLSILFNADEGGSSPEDSQNLFLKAEIVGTCGVFSNNNMSLLVDSTALLTFTPGAWVQLESDSSTDYSTKALALAITPTANANGTCGVAISLDDDATSTPTAEAVASFAVNFGAVNDPPTIASPTASVSTNEGTKVYGITMIIDEGGLSGGSTPMDEDSQAMLVKVSSDRSSDLLPLSRVTMYKYDGSTFNPSSSSYTSLGDNTNDHQMNALKMDLYPVYGYSGTANLTVTLSDGTTTITQTVTLNVTDNTFSWNGWTEVRAYGPAANAEATPTPIGTSGPTVQLVWATPEAIGTSVSISGYNIYRLAGESVEIEDIVATTPINTTPITSTSFNDDESHDLEEKTGYWYLVLPINGANNKVMMNYADDRLIRVIVPDDNRALVHRWMVNKEVCENLGLEPDRANHYRCEHIAPGTYSPAAGGTYQDLGYDLIVDRWEASCNFARGDGECPETGSKCIYRGNPNDLEVTASFGSLYYDRDSGQCWANTDGAGQWKKNTCAYSLLACDDGVSDDNCIGTSDPDTLLSAIQGSYFLDTTSTGQCHYNHDGATGWYSESDSDANIAQIEYALDYSNSGDNKLNVPKNPPLVWFSQDQAKNHCEDTITTISNFDTTSHNMRLPSRLDFIAMAQWTAGASVSTLESGGDLSASSLCNTIVDNELEYVSSPQLPSSMSADTLSASVMATATFEGTPVSLRSVVTASEATKDCQSVFGLQDLVGNIKEWNDDVYTASNDTAETDYLDFEPSSTLYDFEADGNPYSYQFSATAGDLIGPEASQAGNRYWNLGSGVAGTYDYFYLGMGLPVSNATIYGTPIAVSAAASIMSDDFIRFSNEFHLHAAGAITADDDQAAIAAGGAFYSHTGNGDDAGRFSMEMIRKYYQGADTGFRCVAPIGYDE